MISASDILHLPYTQDLIAGGIAYALHLLPYNFYRVDGSMYDRLRDAVAGAAVELAFRRSMSEQNIPFEVKSALPFTDHDRYDVMLGGRRCEIKSFLISQPEQVAQIRSNREVLLNASALVASDVHAAEGHSPRDLYLFAFLTGRITTAREEVQHVIRTKGPYYLVHVMPEAWNRPSQWRPLGKLVLKSESEQPQIVEIGGQDEAGGLCCSTVELPPHRRVEIPNRFFSLAYLHLKSACSARIGIYSPVRRETYLIAISDWRNLWIYDIDIFLTGYITREEFRRHASFVPTGSRVFPYGHTQVKNLALPVSELRPFAELFERIRTSTVTSVGGNGK